MVTFSGDLNLWVGQGGCSFAPATSHAFSGCSVWFFPVNDNALIDAVFRAPIGDVDQDERLGVIAHSTQASSHA